MASASGTSGLLRCPKNLKECIDWVLRATGKDDLNGQDNIVNLKKALNAELGSSGNSDDLKELDKLASGLANFIGYDSGKVNGDGIGNIKGVSYVSSYDSKATWNNLCQNCKCKSNSSSHSCSCSGSPSVCSDPSKCCPNCDVRRAAKIFLGFLPCLYYALKYLYDKCKKDWSSHKIINKDSSLGRFLVGMGFELQKLDEKKTGQNIFGLLNTLFTSPNGPLEKLYEKSKNYFTSLSSPSLLPSSKPSQPKTVREILLWLSGLPFIPQFPKLLQHCNGLCSDIKDSSNPVQFNNFDNFKASLFDSCFLSPFVLGAIEGSKSNEKDFPPYKSEISKFYYPSDPFDLLEKLCDYVRKVFVPLKFLCMQCERKAAEGGWASCTFGQKCAKALESSSTPFSPSSGSCSSCSGHETYLCTWSEDNKNVHEHCREGKCLGSDSSSCNGKHTSGGSAKCTDSCPHPLLRFLVATSDSKSKDSSLFQPPKDFPSMGFKTEQLPSPGRSGESLFFILDVFVGKASSDKKVCFLRDLLRFLLCLTRTPPETLGELFVFFQKFKDPPVFKNLFESYVDDEPGIYDGRKFTNALKDALGKLKGSSHSNSHSKSHPNDLKSLYDCDGPKGSGAPSPTCGPYLNPLIQDASDIFGDDFTKELCSMYLSWICYLPKDFKTLLEKFHTEFSDCCSSCTKIVKCPCALPKLYKNGFTFVSPDSLNNNSKKCSDFLDQLKKFLEENSPLGLLIKAIEAFLWSIRFPFFFGFLYVWFFVLSYFCYVILIKLDTFHTGSHLHLPRSFKILPSTLFSDASSKLKDLSYFSL